MAGKGVHLVAALVFFTQSLQFSSANPPAVNLTDWFPGGKVPAHRLYTTNQSVGTPDLLDCEYVQFYLATRSDPEGSTVACFDGVNREPFQGELNVTKRTIFLVHGWGNSRYTDFTQNVTKAYLEASDVNIIQVDWSKYADLDYLTAEIKVTPVGYTVAQFILNLTESVDLDVDKTELVGFSLGAHVVGVAGYYVTPKIPRVIGLDPAGPLFYLKGASEKITTESGKFVVTLHTCKLRLGISEDLGHVNFNANDGMVQPGCDDDLLGFCSHGRAPDIFAESLGDPEGFLATECGSYLEYELNFCDNEQKTYFNDHVNASLRGNFYFKTESSYPFAYNDTSIESERDISERSPIRTPEPVDPISRELLGRSMRQRKNHTEKNQRKPSVPTSARNNAIHAKKRISTANRKIVSANKGISATNSSSSRSQ